MRQDIYAEIIMAIFTALVVIETHKDEIGIEYFPHLIEHLDEFTNERAHVLLREYITRQ